MAILCRAEVPSYAPYASRCDPLFSTLFALLLSSLLAVVVSSAAIVCHRRVTHAEGQLRGNGGWISSQCLSPPLEFSDSRERGSCRSSRLPSIIPRETYIAGFRSTHLHDASFTRADSLPTPRPSFLFRTRENEVKDAKRDRVRVVNYRGRINWNSSRLLRTRRILAKNENFEASFLLVSPRRNSRLVE